MIHRFLDHQQYPDNLKNLYIVEGTIVNEPKVTERFLHGQSFRAIDAVIADDTGHIRLVGHYNQEIELHLGDRIKVIGANSNPELFAPSYEPDNVEVVNVELRTSPYGSIILTEKEHPSDILVNDHIIEGARQLIRYRDNLLLANAEVSQSTVEISPAEGITLNVNTPPFKSFFLNRILEGMKTKDIEKVSQGQIKESESLKYQIEEDSNGLIKRILINNYRENERLTMIFNTSTWVFTMMMEKIGRWRR